MARRLVVPALRDGGQAQFAVRPIPADESQGLARVLEWAQTHLDRALTVGSLASQANMSARTFARRFKQETGTTPHRWLTHQRILSAQQLLEKSDRPIDWIAESVGLQTAATLREHFRRILRTTPTAYRRAFFAIARRGPAAAAVSPPRPRSDRK